MKAKSFYFELHFVAVSFKSWGWGNGHDSDTENLSCLTGESHDPLLTCILCILENGGDEDDELCFAQGTHYHKGSNSDLALTCFDSCSCSHHSLGINFTA